MIILSWNSFKNKKKKKNQPEPKICQITSKVTFLNMDEHLLQTHDGESGLAVSSILGKEKYKIKGTLQIFTP